MNTGLIEEFQDEYRWLSNFWSFETQMRYGKGAKTLYFKNVETFFHAMKTLDFEERKSCINAKSVKKHGKTLTLRADWIKIRKDVMLYGLRYKFGPSNPGLRAKLVATTGKYLQEGNRWGDKFWGVDMNSGEGENILGELLMQVRKEIEEGKM